MQEEAAFVLGAHRGDVEDFAAAAMSPSKDGDFGDTSVKRRYAASKASLGRNMRRCSSAPFSAIKSKSDGACPTHNGSSVLVAPSPPDGTAPTVRLEARVRCDLRQV
jgi:hypothetical protein